MQAAAEAAAFSLHWSGLRCGHRAARKTPAWTLAFSIQAAETPMDMLSVT